MHIRNRLLCKALLYLFAAPAGCFTGGFT